jgi:hypothetical protein
MKDTDVQQPGSIFPAATVAGQTRREALTAWVC